MEKEYRCAIIGQHPMRFPWGFDEEDTQCRRMKLELAQCIMELRQCGVTEFQVACDPGVGLYAGEIVNITKQNDEAMRLVCVTPFEEQATKWTPQLRDRYFDMLADCTDLSCVDYQETPNAQLTGAAPQQTQTGKNGQEQPLFRRCLLRRLRRKNVLLHLAEL